MKTASKVFIILSMVGTAVAMILTLSIFGAVGNTACARMINENPSMEITAQQLFTMVMIIMGVFFAIALVSVEIVGAIALKKLGTATSKDQLVAIGVCTLIFCSLIGGILMLCISDDDLKQA